MLCPIALRIMRLFRLAGGHAFFLAPGGLCSWSPSLLRGVPPLVPMSFPPRLGFSVLCEDSWGALCGSLTSPLGPESCLPWSP